jgi:hypothetical protein
MMPEILTDADVTKRFGPRGDLVWKPFLEASVPIYELKGAHIIALPGTETLMVGGQAGDETYSHAEVGILNIAKARRLVRGLRGVSRNGLIRGPEPVEITGDLITHARVAEQDFEYLRTMLPTQRDEPVLFMRWERGLHLFDGQARIARLALDKALTVRAYIFERAMQDELRIRIYKRVSGAWKGIPEAGAADRVDQGARDLGAARHAGVAR